MVLQVTTCADAECILIVWTITLHLGHALEVAKKFCRFGIDHWPAWSTHSHTHAPPTQKEFDLWTSHVELFGTHRRHPWFAQHAWIPVLTL